MNSATRWPTSIIRTAPIAKLGATKARAPSPPFQWSVAHLRSFSRSKPVVPTTTLTPACRHLWALGSAWSGTVKSTTTSAASSTSPRSEPSDGSARPLSSSPAAASIASQTVVPIRPAAPATATWIGSGMRRQHTNRQSASLTGATALRKQASSAPMQAAEMFSGA